MRPPLEIMLAPERLDQGEIEERACFGLFQIRTDVADLTGGMDFFISAYRSGPLVSGYHAAEWLAWNWWRLCYEPRAAKPEWWRSHKMTAIGEGYVWPNITIYSDGVRTTILSEPSVRPDAKPFRYLGSVPSVLPSVEFQAALDRFIATVQGRLREQGVGETALDRIWHDVVEERQSPELSKRRRLEALLGHDADGTGDRLIDQLMADTAEIGEPAVEELAAHGGQGATLPTVADLRQSARENGYDAQPRNAARLKNPMRPTPSDVAAWRLGADAARSMRSQEHLGAGPLGDDRLCDLAGVTAEALRSNKTGSGLSFVLDETAGNGHMVLRSRWKAGRRFELARLLADRLVAPANGRLHVATRAHTYRQKAQRSFAAEFLSPFEAVDAMLDGDYSAEAQSDAAEHFQVSDRTILTLLVNHQRVERDELEVDAGIAA